VSFPSGHTTVAFAVSAVLAERIKNPWASVGLYGAATAAAVSRMYTQDHWLSDVVFTAAYTTAIAHAVVKWFEKENEGDAHAFNIVPTTSGVSIVWRF
jgi:membrane-associated phospholipid phosphatase